MRVEIHDGLKGTLSIPASRVVIYDDFDNPLSVAVNIEGNQFIVATVVQKSFQKILKALGINKTVIVDHLDPRRLKALE